MDIGVYGARSIPSTYSGYETFLTTLLPELVERGHRVTMYCRSSDTEGSGPYRGVRRVSLPALPGKQFNTLSHGALAALRARLANHDVVLVVNVANAPFCAVARWTGQRVVMNTDGQEWLRGKWGRAARGYFKGSARIARFTANALVSDCAAMAEVYRNDFGATSTIIPYCSPDLDMSTDREVLAHYELEPSGYHLIAGRLNPENNIDRVATAYAESEPTRPLLVLGTANYDSPVQRRLDDLAARSPHVRLLGHVDDRVSFLTLVGQAASYIHGHSVGGMNPSLVEAMHAGALVLANDTSFNRETLDSAGRYFDFNGNGLGDAVRKIEQMTTEDTALLRKQACERATGRFTIHDVVSAYEDLMAATMDRSSRSVVTIPTAWDPPSRP